MLKGPSKFHPFFNTKARKFGKSNTRKERKRMTKMHITLFMLAAIAGCFMMGSVSAMTHIVGGSHGWSLPDNQTFFADWAKPRTFGVGDKLGKFNAFGL